MTKIEPPLGSLLELFERCLEEDPARRLVVARRLCSDQPDLLEPLIALLKRDQELDQACLNTAPDFTRLSKLVVSDRLRKGQTAGPFRIEECIGSGGMGTVYRVRRVDGRVEQEAALKILSPDRINPLLIDRFSNERRVLASLEHPGICRFFDAGTLPDGQPYVLMELIRGKPLLDYCNQSELSIRQRVELFLAIADAVAHAHRRLVVHRDIKSENILVDEMGQPKLLDFGIAKTLSVEQDWEQTRTAERFLTPKTAAPEQLLGEPIGVACDIYALGLLLYELLSGQAPFDFSGLRSSEVEHLVLSQPPPPMAQRSQNGEPEQWQARGYAKPNQLRRALRGDLETIVIKCLRKRPDNRYASVDQLSNDLSSWLEERPIRLRSRDRGYRMRKFVARNRLAVGLTAGLFAVLLLSSFFLAWQSINLEQERRFALLERDRARYAVNLLRRAFESADPAGSLGADVKAAQILEAAREPVMDLRQSQPELFVSLTQMLADVHLSLRQNQPAVELSSAGLEVARQLGMAPEDERQLLLINARSLTNTRQREEAEDALARIHEIDQGEHPDWLHAQGQLALLSNEREQALSLLTRAVEAYETSDLPFRESASAFWDHATTLSQTGEHDVSLARFEAILQRALEELGAQHPLVSLTRIRQIEALVRAGDVDSAGQVAEQIKGDLFRWYGESSPMAGRLHGTLGMLELRRENPRQAAFHYQRARSIWTQHLSPDHQDIIRVTINLAFALNYVDGGEVEAEAVYREALSEIVDRSDEGRHTEFLLRGLLADMLSRQERFEESLALLLEPSRLDLEQAVEVSQWRRAMQHILEGQGCEAADGAPILVQQCHAAARRVSDFGN